MLANPAAQLMSAVAIVVALTVGPAASPTQPKVNPQGAALKAFMERVDAYAKLQNKLDDFVPGSQSPTNNPGEIEAHQAALTERIRQARAHAKRGDIFGDAEPLFREIIRRDSAWRSDKDERAAMKEVPPRDPPRVNAAYPDKAPLATVPPLILTNLQRLPEGVESRFMGRDLILRDVKANLIVDFINEAVPDPKL